ncbi:MAG: hypothetical protein K0R41_1666 [Geminicoccaceae bacterium]|nr:hypothetical protein [Geminicoccaceae bacterium]
MIDCLTRDPIVALGLGPDGGRQATLSAPNLRAKDFTTVSPFRLELVLLMRPQSGTEVRARCVQEMTQIVL